jgi:hypothetical protein
MKVGLPIVLVALMATGCPPSSYERDWVLKKGDYPTATLYGFGDNRESCEVIASNFNTEAVGGANKGPAELRGNAASGMNVRPTTWICAPRRTWLEVLLGMYP